jgi:aspartate racemase
VEIGATRVSKTVGVIGGMGPAATVDFMRRIVEATPAAHDQGHVHVIVDSDPSVPDRTAATVAGGPDPSPWLAAMARRLEIAGAEILVMPCNSAHNFAGAITAAVGVPLVDWPGVVAEHLVDEGVRAVGVLGTDGTLAGGVFRGALAARGCAGVEPSPEAQRGVSSVIAAVKAGAWDRADALHLLRRAAEDLAEHGAEALVLACTELSVLAAERSLDAPAAMPVFDASDIVAKHVVALALA